MRTGTVVRCLGPEPMAGLWIWVRSCGTGVLWHNVNTRVGREHEQRAGCPAGVDRIEIYLPRSPVHCVNRLAHLSILQTSILHHQLCTSDWFQSGKSVAPGVESIKLGHLACIGRLARQQPSRHLPGPALGAAAAVCMVLVDDRNMTAPTHLETGSVCVGVLLRPVLLAPSLLLTARLNLCFKTCTTPSHPPAACSSCLYAVARRSSRSSSFSRAASASSCMPSYARSSCGNDAR